MKWQNLGYKDRVAQLAGLPPHEILGVAQGCSPEVLKQAYIRLIKAYHPDRADPFMARQNEDILKLINAAYEKLKDARHGG